MFSSFAILAAFVASVSAISITSPSGSQGWTNDGAQTVKWTAVSTDPKNCTIVLITANNPSTAQVLDALVDTSLDTITVNPPSEGWPAPGSGFRVNFVNSTEDLNTILAQSDPFAIKACSVQAITYVYSLATTPTTPTATPATPTNSAGAGASGSTSDSASAPISSNAALPSVSVHTSLAGALVLLSALLAQF
ncbi:hypothetical protein DFH06DRAFT_1119805 [Mycena polygramma]|nr:hypothetical protein DFH06DRAFT_1119805 [Mycena polygramma]